MKLIDTIIEKYVIDDNDLNNNITVIYEADNFKIGKQNNGISFIIDADDSRTQKYKNGDMKISLNSWYVIDKIKGTYTVLTYYSKDKNKIRIFIDTLISSIGIEKLSSDDLYNLYNDISNIFKPMTFDNNKFIGLIGELMFIDYMHDLFEINMTSYYQSTNDHLVDFKYNDTIFEIKTTLSDIRKHIINNDQLRGNGYLVSIRIVEENNGVTFSEYFERLKPLFVESPKKFAHVLNFLDTLPKQIRSEKYKISNDLIKCFHFNDIPKISDYDESISKISFTCDFSNLNATNIII